MESIVFSRASDIAAGQLLHPGLDVPSKKKGGCMNSFQVLTSSESNEWYTPREITDAASRVMGGIELDPASNAMAQEWINADRYFTQDQDGFNQPWVARSMWLNSPYGQRNIPNGVYGSAAWIKRATAAYKDDYVGQVVLLCRGDSKPLKQLQKETICCVADRIKFVSSSDPTKNNPVPGTKIFYLGPNVADFAREFQAFGSIVVPYHWYLGAKISGVAA